MIDILQRTKPVGSCLFYIGALNKDGYGVLHKELAHRFVYKALHGEIQKGFHVRHTCDNPPCINPSHLRAGPAIENVKDAIMKGRRARQDGLNNGNAKLTPLAVKAIRDLYATGCYSCVDLSKKFWINQSHVWRVAKGKNWR